MSKTHEHLEHAEHAQHAAHDPFDRRVAVSMAIIAACLAAVSTLGHRKHNDVLRIVGEANRFRTEAAAAEVEKSNLFAWYQSKRTRTLQMESAVVQMAALPATVTDPAVRKVVEDWKVELTRVTDPKKRKALDDEIAEINRNGKLKEAEAKKLLAAADDLKDDAIHNHHQADRLDMAHLSAEIGLVVCSLALLTKKRGFWYFGMASTAASLLVAGSAFLMEHHPVGDHAPAGHTAPADSHGHPPHGEAAHGTTHGHP